MNKKNHSFIADFAFLDTTVNKDKETQTPSHQPKLTVLPERNADHTLSVEEWDVIDQAIAQAVGAIRAAGGFGKVDFTFEAGKLVFSNLHIATSYKPRKPA